MNVSVRYLMSTCTTVLSSKPFLTNQILEGLWFSFPANAQPVDRHAREHTHNRHQRVSGSRKQRKDQEEETTQKEGDRNYDVELKRKNISLIEK